MAPKNEDGFVPTLDVIKRDTVVRAMISSLENIEDAVEMIIGKNVASAFLLHRVTAHVCSPAHDCLLVSPVGQGRYPARARREGSRALANTHAPSRTTAFSSRLLDNDDIQPSRVRLRYRMLS